MLEVVEERLAHERTTCCAWNRRGTLLACGTSSGTIVLWCWDTRAVTRTWKASRGESEDEDGESRGGGDADSDAVLTIAWSLNGRKIVVSKASGVIEVWDVLEEDTTAVISNAGLCASVCFSNASSSGSTLIVSPNARAPYVRGSGLRGAKETSLPSPHGGDDIAAPAALALSSKNGKYVFVGDAKGAVSVVDAQTMSLVQTIAVPNASLVKRLELCRNGKHLVVVSNAPTIFGMDVNDSESAGADVLSQGVEYQSPSASRLQWGAAAYPWDGAYVYGVSSGAPHEIHVWDRVTGVLKCVLEGPGESKGVTHLATHPIRDVAVALGANGQLYVWSRKHVEDWSAFDPSFVTLVENKEYVEREDEFDVKPPVEKTMTSAAASVLDVEPDTFTNALNEALQKKVKYYSDDTDEDVLHHLPLRIKANPEAQRIVEERRAKWERKAKRREKRARDEAERAKASVGKDTADAANMET